LPLPEIVLASGLFLASAALLRRAAAENHDVDPALLPPRWASLPLLAVLAGGVVSTRFSEHSFFGLGLLPRLGGNMAIFLLAASAPRDWIGQMRKWWMAVAVIVAANGLLRLRSEPEFISTLGNWNFLGVYLAASVVIGTSIGTTWPLLGNLILVTAMWWCGSRGAWLALGTVAMLWFLACGNRFLQRWPARAIMVMLVLTTAGLLARPYVLRQWQTDVRPMIWKATFRMIAARPLVGHGLGTYVAEYPKVRPPEYFLRPKATNVTDHAHNELLEITAEQGLIGLAATLWLWVTAVWCGIRACRQSAGAERRAVLGLLGAMLVLMLHGMVDVDLQYLPNQSLLWLLMGLLVAVDPTPARRVRITIRSRPARWCAAATCLALGIWVATMAVIRPIVADWQDREARIAEENGDLRTAEQDAREALGAQPFRLSTRHLLAGVLSRLPDPEGRDMAIDQCLRIEELAPDYADVTYNLGQLYLTASRATEALPYLRRAVEINPYAVDRRMALASALHDVGQNDEAMRQLDRVLRMQPDHPEAGTLRQRIQQERAP
jgi:O-antigen ligase/Flp pilus assembly protein TadD